MKKAFFIVLLSLAVLVVLTAQENSSSAVKIELLLADGLEKNFDEIQKISSDLTYDEKRVLFEERSDNFIAPLLLNGLIGFGSGSFLQGDHLGGGIGLGIDVASYASVIGASAILLFAPYANSSEAAFEQLDLSYKLLIGGSIGIAVSRIFQIVRPITFSSSYNDKLKDSLNVSAISYHFVPSVTTDGNPAIVASLSLKL